MMKENVCRNVYVCIMIASPYIGEEHKRKDSFCRYLSHHFLFLFVLTALFFNSCCCSFSRCRVAPCQAFFFSLPMCCYRTIRCCMSHIILENVKKEKKKSNRSQVHPSHLARSTPCISGLSTLSVPFIILLSENATLFRSARFGINVMQYSV